MNVKLAGLILRGAVQLVAASKEAYDIVSTMKREGRDTLTAEEEEKLNAVSASIHDQHAQAIARAEREGR